MIRIANKPVKPIVSLHVPGSKSYTHRLLIAAALSDGVCRINHPLRSEDTLFTIKALQQMGIFKEDQADSVIVHGARGRFKPVDQPIYLGNSGTSMRLLSALAVLGEGAYTLTGAPRMGHRPIQALIDSLHVMGVPACTQKHNGCPPLVISGGRCKGGHTRIDCSTSSQYLSGLLMIAPCLEQGLRIDVFKGPVSKPYIDMTVDIMQKFGIQVQRSAYNRFEVAGGQAYQAGEYTVEPDASQAGYFWAAAAVTGACVKVRGVFTDTRQGDARLAEIFGRMGCQVANDPDGIAVTGSDLKAVDVDMGHMPDTVPTLAVVAAFAQGITTLRNVAHLRAKESDRLSAVAQELNKMGIDAHCGPDELQITGGRPHGAEIETYDDHRIAMSFAVAGLKVPGVAITNEACVKKSFPEFWEVFAELYQ